MMLEVCVDSLDSALAAQEGGADRIELCSSLAEGGLTPSLGLLEEARSQLHIPIHAMLRPRGGDFCYSPPELMAMQRDLEHFKQAGADGVVLGILEPDGTIAQAATQKLLEQARPLSVTFHRAFDLTRDPFEALEVLLALGVDRLLTSGQAATALEGLGLIRQLLEAAQNRMAIMPGGGVEASLKAILQTGVQEVHLSARSQQESPMRFRRNQVAMGSDSSEYTRLVADAERIRGIKKTILEFSKPILL